MCKKRDEQLTPPRANASSVTLTNHRVKVLEARVKVLEAENKSYQGQLVKQEKVLSQRTTPQQIHYHHNTTNNITVNSAVQYLEILRNSKLGPIPKELLDRDAEWESRNPSNMHAWTVDQMDQHLPGLQDVARLTNSGPALLVGDGPCPSKFMAVPTDVWSDVEEFLAARVAQVVEERHDASDKWNDRVKDECKVWKKSGIKKCCLQNGLIHPAKIRHSDHQHEIS